MGDVNMKKCLLIIMAAVVMAFAAFSGADAADVFPSFSSKSLAGEVVDDSIFAGQKLTVVNIWATWCPPCLGEMPDLGRLARTMPAGSRLVGLVLDAEGEDKEVIKEAQRILSGAGADFLQIIPVSSMAPLVNTITAIPTTVFVDSKGQMVGELLVGSRSEDDYRESIEDVLKNLK
jgi:thiol-disulfide isomerase/thioredoxin